METSMNTKTPNDTDDVTRAEADVAARKADLTRSLRRVEKSSQRIVKSIGHELKPALIAGLAVATLATVAGVTIALSRRNRRNVWLPPQRPSALATAARGAGMFLLRLAVRRVAAEIVARLDTSPAATQEPAALPQS